LITLYGRKSSDSVQKTAWMLGETGRAFEHVELGGKFGGLDGEEFLTLNPHGRVPVLVDGELVVWESGAIIRYLAASYCQGTLWLDDPSLRCVPDQWMDWGQTQVYPLVNRLFWNTVRTPGDEQDKSQIDSLLGELNSKLEKLEHQLENNSLVCGDDLSVADITIGTPLYRYYQMPIERPDYRNLARYYERLCQRQSYRDHVMIPFDELRGRLAF